MSNKYEPGKIYALSAGYSMLYYKYYLVDRVSDKSVWVTELESKFAGTADGGYNQQYYTVPDITRPKGKSKAYRLTKYLGSEWDGKPLYEDHMD